MHRLFEVMIFVNNLTPLYFQITWSHGTLILGKNVQLELTRVGRRNAFTFLGGRISLFHPVVDFGRSRRWYRF